MYRVRLRSEIVRAAVAARVVTGALAAVLLGAAGIAPASRGDDIILTDGRKISGTIVGMEKGSFRVETDFGIALVRKDKVARIEVNKPDVSKAPAPAENAPAAPPPVARPAPPPRPATIQARRPPGGKIEEHTEGITYFNDSYGFQMYKPPNWKSLPETMGSIPNAVAVLGTEDEATMIIVGSVVYDAPPSAYAAVLGSALKKLYADFEMQPEEQIDVSGRPAIRRTFSGKANDREWHGMVVNLADNQIHYGIIGLTSEENYQFKSSVLGKIVASFRFQ